MFALVIAVVSADVHATHEVINSPRYLSVSLNGALAALQQAITDYARAVFMCVILLAGGLIWCFIRKIRPSCVDTSFTRLADNIQVGVCILHDGRFYYANNKLAQMLRYSCAELQAGIRFDQLLLSQCKDKGSPEKMADLYSRADSVAYEARMRTKTGDIVDVEIQANEVVFENLKRVFIIINDVGTRKSDEASARLNALVYDNTLEATDETDFVVDAKPAFSDVTAYCLNEVIGGNMSLLASNRQGADFYQQMWRQANYDFLTGLPNRQMFQTCLQEILSKSCYSNSVFALIFLDLDLFKDVNDSLGHNIGDKLLVEVGRRLLECVRAADTVARLGGDEFTVIVTDVKDIAVVERIGRQILHAVSRPYSLEDDIAVISVSLGITVFPQDGCDAGELLKNADMAMYAAKESGRNQYCFFRPAMREAVHARIQLSRDLQAALSKGQFRLYYQPIVNISTGVVTKAEALMRWQHPTLGLVPPSEFIPVAEDSGLIVDIGNWVFSTALEQAARWQKTGDSIQISVNVSPSQFHADAVNAEDWLEQIVKAGLDASAMMIEVSERVLLRASPATTKSLSLFRQAGLKIALDDFGSGFSSLTYLKRYPIDYIKIDQSFIANLALDRDDLALCEAMIVMAHKLGLKVIAEGVSAGKHVELLQGAQCDDAQGLLFCQPLPAGDFMAWRHAWQTRHADTERLCLP